MAAAERQGVGRKSFMNSRYLRLVAIAFASAAVAFGVFALGSLMAWRPFPYPEGADELQWQMIWTWHILGEKGAQFVLLPVLGFVAARLHRPSWRAGVATAVAAGLLFQGIAIGVYLVRFGLGAYHSYHTFWGTLSCTVFLAGLFGFFAVWRQYRAEKNGPTMQSSELPPAGAAGSRSP